MPVVQRRPQSFALAVQEITEMGLGLLTSSSVNVKDDVQSIGSTNDSFASTPIASALPLSPAVEGSVSKEEQMAKMMAILGNLVDIYRMEHDAGPPQADGSKEEVVSQSANKNPSALGLEGIHIDDLEDSDEDDSIFYSAVESQEDDARAVLPVDESQREDEVAQARTDRRDTEEVEKRYSSAECARMSLRRSRVSFVEVEPESSAVRTSPVKPLKSVLRPLKVVVIEETAPEPDPGMRPTFAKTYRPRGSTMTSPRSAPSMEQMREEALQSIAETQDKNDPMHRRNSIIIEGDNARIAKATRLPRPTSLLHTIEQEDSDFLVDPIKPSYSTSHIEYISYARETIAPRQDAEEIRDVLVESFPDTCDAPYEIMYDTNGDPLPPLKHEETGEQERCARAQAMIIQTCASQKHCLIKSSVVLESRSVMWKRTAKPPCDTVSSSDDKQVRRRSSIWKLSTWKSSKPHATTQQHDLRNQCSSASAPSLPALPDPWSVQLAHERVAQLQTQKRAAMTLQMSNTSTFGQCPRCNGAQTQVCATCKGAEADECFWCDGTGVGKHTSRHACEPCKGSGQLKCATCAGSLRQMCKTCSGQGQGHFVVMQRVNLRLVKFAPKPIDERHFVGGDDELRTFAMNVTRDHIEQLIVACGEKHKRAFRPLSASCVVLTSFSDVIKVHIPQAIKLKKRVSRLRLRDQVVRDNELATALRQASSNVRYFILPTDTELRPVELSERECDLRVAKIKQQILFASMPNSSASSPRIMIGSPMLDKMIGKRPMSILSRSSSQRTLDEVAFFGHYDTQVGQSAHQPCVRHT